MPTSMPDLLDIVLEAGHAVMSVYRSGQNHVQTKTDLNPSTDADRAAHILLAKAIPKLLPQTSVVPEEDVDSLKKQVCLLAVLADRSAGWHQGIFGPQRGVHGECGFVEDGQAVLGVVYPPALNQMCTWRVAKMGPASSAGCSRQPQACRKCLPSGRQQKPHGRGQSCMD